MRKIQCAFVVLLLLALVTLSQAQVPNTPVPTSYFGFQLLNSSNYPTVSTGSLGKQSGAEWPQIEPNAPTGSGCPGVTNCTHTYNWSVLDGYVSQANSHSIPISFMWEYAPGWANGSVGCGGGGGSATECIGPVTDLIDMDAFITALVTRYNGSNGHGTLLYFELANESFSGEGSYSGTYAQFASEKNRLRTDIKAANSSALVGCCGETYADDTFVSGGSMDHIWAAGLVKTLDFVSFHAYPHHADDGDYYVAGNCVVDTGGNETGPMGAVACVKGGMARNSVSSTIPIYMTEGSWGDSSYSNCINHWSGGSGSTGCEGGSDALKSAFVSRYMMLLWASGASRMAWYTWDGGSYGTLSAAAKTAWQQTYNWMNGNTFTSLTIPTSGTVWTIGISETSGRSALAVWNVAGNSTYTPGTQYVQYRDLTGGTTTISPGTPITIGIQPVLLESSPGGSVTLSPSSQSFGSVVVSQTSPPQTFTVGNGLATSVTVGTISFTGSNPGDFATMNDNCSGQSLPAGNTCTVQVTFTPTTTGSRSATLSVPGTGFSTLTSSLTGTGTSPGVPAITPSSFNFGNVITGASSAAQTFTVHNGSGSSISISSVTTVMSTVFVVGSNTCSGTVTAGSTCTFTITFTPATTGTVNDTVSVAGTGYTSPITSALSGTGTSPAAPTLLPSSFSFGSTTVGGVSANHTFTLTNNSGVTLTSISISFVTGTNFIIVTNNCSSTLANGLSCTIAVAFKPTTTGALTDTLQASDSDGSSPQQSSLSGTGLTPAAPGQNQTNDVSGTQPLYQINGRWAEGKANGYWVTYTNGGLVQGHGLNVYVSPGTAFCIPGTRTGYSGGSLALTDNATNYVELDYTTCLPVFNTTSYTSINIPLAIVTTSSGSVVGVEDDRTFFRAPTAILVGFEDMIGQSSSLGTQTLVSSTPVAGRYQIGYYLDESATCTLVGSGSVLITLNWTDASNARQQVSSGLTFTTALGTGGFVSAIVPIWSANASAISFTTTYVSCTSGTAQYDVHAWVTKH